MYISPFYGLSVGIGNSARVSFDLGVCNRARVPVSVIESCLIPGFAIARVSFDINLWESARVYKSARVQECHLISRCVSVLEFKSASVQE